MSKIVLASASPRRKEILSVFTKDFVIKTTDINEKFNNGESPEAVSMALAFQKAYSVATICQPGDIVIGADTVVVKNEILGKPKDYDDAFRMLNMLQNDVHYVLTGIAVLEVGSSNKIVDFSMTKVKIKQLTGELIRGYIDTGEVWDKAGSYAIQGKGASIVEWIHGDYFNVVGLPIAKLIHILKIHFNYSLI